MTLQNSVAFSVANHLLTSRQFNNSLHTNNEDVKLLLPCMANILRRIHVQIFKSFLKAASR